MSINVEQEAIGTLDPNEMGDRDGDIHNPFTVFLGILIVVILFQIGIYQWQRINRKSYLIASLAGLWLIPAFLSVKAGFIRFLLIWLIYSVVNFFVIRKATLPKIDPNTPRFFYRFYRFLFDATMAIAGFGYALFLLCAFLIPSPFIFDLSFNLMFYGLYFGVLSRDLVDYAVEKMSVTIGYYAQDGLPRKHLDSHTCAVCGETTTASSSSSSDAADPQRAGLLSNSNESVVLNCNHRAHIMCLHGWCLIGKKDTCPYCKEKVDLLLINTNPWKDPEFMYGKFLDAVRYMIVWMPGLLIIIHFVVDHVRN